MSVKIGVAFLYALIGGLCLLSAGSGVGLILNELNFGLALRLFMGGTLISFPPALIYILKKK